jgi:hypothetical protein
MSFVAVAERHARSIVFVALALALAGAVLAVGLPVGLFPQVSFPRVVISLDAGDRPADQTAVLVTRPVEEAIRATPGVLNVRSQTTRGSSQIRNELSEIQSDAECASSAWSKSASHPWDHESPDAYRRRAAQFHKQHSSLWKEVDLRELSGQALKNATAQIFNDSYAMACSNEPYAGGDLREVRRVNRDTGHVIKEYYGSPSSWMAHTASITD